MVATFGVTACDNSDQFRQDMVTTQWENTYPFELSSSVPSETEDVIRGEFKRKRILSLVLLELKFIQMT